MPRTFSSMMGYKPTTSGKPILNPIFFYRDNSIKSEIKEVLYSRARAFVSELGLKPEDIEDLLIVGSQASFDYASGSDVDVTILLDRGLNLTKDDLRSLSFAASLYTYKMSPSIDGLDLNFYLSHRNIGSLRPAKQGIYSLGKNKWLKPPSRLCEAHPNYIASKTNSIIELIEECVQDDSQSADGCAEMLLKKLKRYRISGLKSEKGEASTQNMVWRLLSRSGYIQSLKDKIDAMKRDFYRIKSPDLVSTKELKKLVKSDETTNRVPSSLLYWQKKMMKGGDITPMVRRIDRLLSIIRETK